MKPDPKLLNHLKNARPFVAADWYVLNSSGGVEVYCYGSKSMAELIAALLSTCDEILSERNDEA